MILGWLWGRGASGDPPPPRLRALSQRLDDVEDTLQHFERRFIRLQGQVTGYIRYAAEELGDGDDEEE